MAIGNIFARMTVTRNDQLPGYHTIGIGGHLTTTQGEAQELINGGARITYDLWGEDTFSDDHLLHREALSMQATAQGLEFSSGIGDVKSSALDEDWGRDELYVIVCLVRGDGRVLRASQTSTVRGDF